MAPRLRCFFVAFLLMPPATVVVAQEPGAAAGRVQAWLKGPLTGNDNNMAKMKLARITKEGERHRVFIENQFGFTCELDFGLDGSPSQLRECTASESGWTASPAMIRLRCQIDTTKRRERCEGSYRLKSANLDDPSTFTLVRRF